MTPTDQAQRVCRYKGLLIVLESIDEGGLYCAYNGCDIAADNAESIEDAKAQIDEYWAEQYGRGGPYADLGRF